MQYPVIQGRGDRHASRYGNVQKENAKGKSSYHDLFYWFYSLDANSLQGSHSEEFHSCIYSFDRSFMHLFINPFIYPFISCSRSVTCHSYKASKSLAKRPSMSRDDPKLSIKEITWHNASLDKMGLRYSLEEAKRFMSTNPSFYRILSGTVSIQLPPRPPVWGKPLWTSRARIPSAPVGKGTPFKASVIHPLHTTQLELRTDIGLARVGLFG